MTSSRGCERPTSRSARSTVSTPSSPIRQSAAARPRCRATAAAFVAALNAGREDEAKSLIDKHFGFGVDCDYANRRLWYMTDREAAGYWLHLRIADHDRIEILRTLDGGAY